MGYNTSLQKKKTSFFSQKKETAFLDIDHDETLKFNVNRLPELETPSKANKRSGTEPTERNRRDITETGS